MLTLHACCLLDTGSRGTGSPRLCGLRPSLRLRGERLRCVDIFLSTQVDNRRLRLTAEDFQSHGSLAYDSSTGSHALTPFPPRGYSTPMYYVSVCRRFFCLLALVSLTLPLGAAPAKPTFPKRIVSLSPGTTEMLFALGLGARVVGDTTYCDYPPAAKAIAKVGDVSTSDEKVLALHPDLVVADGVANAQAVARLTRLHLPVLAVTPTSLSGMEDSLRQIGARTGTGARAKVVVGQMEQKVRLAGQMAAADRRPRPRVLVVVQVSPLWTAGRGTFMDDLVTRAGGVNVGNAISGYGTFSKEQLVIHPPDVILGDTATRAAFFADPLLRRLPAVRAGRIVAIDPDLTSRPGPRLADGLVQVARAIHR